MFYLLCPQDIQGDRCVPFSIEASETVHLSAEGNQLLLSKPDCGWNSKVETKCLFKGNNGSYQSYPLIQKQEQGQILRLDGGRCSITPHCISTLDTQLINFNIFIIYLLK